MNSFNCSFPLECVDPLHSFILTPFPSFYIWSISTDVGSLRFFFRFIFFLLACLYHFVVTSTAKYSYFFLYLRFIVYFSCISIFFYILMSIFFYTFSLVFVSLLVYYRLYFLPLMSSIYLFYCYFFVLVKYVYLFFFGLRIFPHS